MKKDVAIGHLDAVCTRVCVRHTHKPGVPRRFGSVIRNGVHPVETAAQTWSVQRSSDESLLQLLRNEGLIIIITQHILFCYFYTTKHQKLKITTWSCNPNLSTLVLLGCWWDCASPGYVIYEEDKRLVLLSNVLRYLSTHFKSAVLGKWMLMWHKAKGDLRLRTQSLKKENKFCSLENGASGRTCPLDWKKQSPSWFVCVGGGVAMDVLWHLIGLRSRELKPAMSFQSIIWTQKKHLSRNLGERSLFFIPFCLPGVRPLQKRHTFFWKKRKKGRKSSCLSRKSTMCNLAALCHYTIISLEGMPFYRTSDTYWTLLHSTRQENMLLTSIKHTIIPSA